MKILNLINCHFFNIHRHWAVTELNMETKTGKLKLYCKHCKFHQTGTVSIEDANSLEFKRKHLTLIKG